MKYYEKTDVEPRNPSLQAHFPFNSGYFQAPMLWSGLLETMRWAGVQPNTISSSSERVILPCFTCRIARYRPETQVVEVICQVSTPWPPAASAAAPGARPWG